MIKRNKKSARPKINTSALPDIIFMLLFFFMVVTVLRQEKKLLKVQLPEATDITKLYNRSAIQYIYIGKPVDTQNGTVERVQINDAFIPVNKLEAAVRTLKTNSTERIKSDWINSLKVDREVPMGIVSDVKTALRRAEQLKLNYEVIAEVE
ncbi:MAG: ExbD/TolR family protein [Saprospiraceae bacterium]